MFHNDDNDHTAPKKGDFVALVRRWLTEPPEQIVEICDAVTVVFEMAKTPAEELVRVVYSEITRLEKIALEPVPDFIPQEDHDLFKRWLEGMIYDIKLARNFFQWCELARRLAANKKAQIGADLTAEMVKAGYDAPAVEVDRDTIRIGGFVDVKEFAARILKVETPEDLKRLLDEIADGKEDEP